MKPTENEFANLEAIADALKRLYEGFPKKNMGIALRTFSENIQPIVDNTKMLYKSVPKIDTAVFEDINKASQILFANMTPISNAMKKFYESIHKIDPVVMENMRKALQRVADVVEEVSLQRRIHLMSH